MLREQTFKSSTGLSYLPQERGGRGGIISRQGPLPSGAHCFSEARTCVSLPLLLPINTGVGASQWCTWISSWGTSLNLVSLYAEC